MQSVNTGNGKVYTKRSNSYHIKADGEVKPTLAV